MFSVSDDPRIIKTLSSIGELHFEILYYLVYVYEITESKKICNDQELIPYADYDCLSCMSCCLEYMVTATWSQPLSFELFPGDKQS